jgi:hypothetical protein
MFKVKAMLVIVAGMLLLLGMSVLSAAASELTWRNDVAPIVEAKCAMCHGANAPEFNDWMLLGDEQRKTVAPRMDTYPHFMSYVVWPATGAMMRRLDDGSASGGKAGNMYQYLGDSDEERAKNLQTIKSWLGDGAWNLNRFNARGDTPGITKEQLGKIKAKY